MSQADGLSVTVKCYSQWEEFESLHLTSQDITDHGVGEGGGAEPDGLYLAVLKGGAMGVSYLPTHDLRISSRVPCNKVNDVKHH